ncbi:hypothetical protein [Streptomyces acidicola]|uniref:hypothetical protein n=1 Tax=Streptomyces acidicola TaxID=2596892 RepID=UPI00342B31F1
MSPRQAYPEPPVSLPDPTRPPKPARGCDVCAALDRQRAAAEQAKNIGAATACEVEMRNHPKHRKSAP